MTDKLTDKEIVKALECCTTNGASCKDCPAFVKVDRSNCKKYFRGAIDLINRLQCERNKYRRKVQNQREEIKRLQAEKEGLKGHPKDGFFNLLGNCLVFSKTLKDYNDMRKGLKAEAYKECIEKVKETALVIKENAFQGCYVISKGNLDNLLKELVGEK